MREPERVSLESLPQPSEAALVLRDLYPQAFSEGKLDFDELRRSLEDLVRTDGERYGLTWSGRGEAFAQVQVPTSGSLRPDPERSLGFDEAKDIFIEGDNLEVLKLLQRSYHGQVKLIYIDPPYNTGRDFIYPDNYREGLRSYLRYSGQTTDDSTKLVAGTENAGRLHSRWLDMIYPRLFLARNLLRDDGIICCSIDDHEVHNLRHVLDIVFGPESFVGTLVWQSKKGGGSDAGGLVQDQEYILCYSKGREGDSVARTLLPAEPLDETDEKGPYRRGRELNKWGSNSRREDRPTMYFPVPGPGGVDVYPIRNDGDEGCWRWGQRKMLSVVASGDVEFAPRGDGTYVVYEKIRSTDPRSKPFRTWLSDVGTTAQGSTEVTALFDGKKVFDFPKPVSLLKHIVRMGASGPDDLVLDFFAGSCTTAHAVLEVNLEDGGDRRYICCELPMPTGPDSEARAAGFETIADVGRERIRRSISKLSQDFENGTEAGGRTTGFRSFRLSSSSFQTWDPEVTDADQLETELRAFAANLVEGRSLDDVLYELVLKMGGPLAASPVEIDVGVPNTWTVPELATTICLASELDAEAVTTLLGVKANRLVCLDLAFRGRDDVKTNSVLQAADLGVRFMTV